jgi:DNA-directed RNA polymerase sigma subunit (sigma70/sigma32)
MAGWESLAFTRSYPNESIALRRQVADAEQENGRLRSLDEHPYELSRWEVPGGLDRFEYLLYRERGRAVKEVLASLVPRQRLVVGLRLGFVDGREKTYAEIGAALGVGALWASQLIAATRKKPRHPLRARRLRDFH